MFDLRFTTNATPTKKINTLRLNLFITTKQPNHIWHAFSFYIANDNAKHLGVIGFINVSRVKHIYYNNAIVQPY
jgi:hypothetical protein